MRPLPTPLTPQLLLVVLQRVREKRAEQYMYLKCLVNVTFAHMDALPPPLQVFRLFWYTIRFSLSHAVCQRMYDECLRRFETWRQQVYDHCLQCVGRCCSHGMYVRLREALGQDDMPLAVRRDCRTDSIAAAPRTGWKDIMSTHEDLREEIR